MLLGLYISDRMPYICSRDVLVVLFVVLFAFREGALVPIPPHLVIKFPFDSGSVDRVKCHVLLFYLPATWHPAPATEMLCLPIRFFHLLCRPLPGTCSFDC